uniref:Tc1-like transposase DDE domain-containing protein n=1 Tax=uncultured Desulfobacterium sp. TaxID=201089 RepID=E1YDB2_9BACT|nr:hypothetical protein N47_G38800 [uncultured Desulfobacterium sp.]
MAKKRWIIPPEHNGSFVANMEMVLDVYKRPIDPKNPVVCMDESPKQLIAETKVPIPASPGVVAKYDYEYSRCGVCNIFLACEPLAGKRMVKITERKTKLDWASFVEEIAEQYERAEKITLVMDNLNTHKPGSLYETFPPDKAKALWDRFEFVYTPKHGSWLNMAEIELNVLTGQCLKRTKVSLFLKPFKHGFKILRYFFTKHKKMACKMHCNLYTKYFKHLRQLLLDFPPFS